MLLAATLAVALAASAQPDDILIADFEGETYGDWRVEGEAFGSGPAHGTLPNQMPVSGFLGKGLVNSYFHGDGTTGRLTSPPFRIDRRYLNFLIGGGRFPHETCINLLLDGRIVRTATGPNDQPGGSEHLDWHSWDAAEFAGRTATIEIVDNRTGGWGHVNIDQIVQSNRKRQAELQRRELVIQRRYLHLPVKTGAAKRQVRIIANDQNVREFEIELADAEDPDFWAFCDVSTFAGRRVTLEAVLPSGSKSLEAVTQDDSVRAIGIPAIKLYDERLRPQFHFTSRRGWLNDPNGLVYYKGEYHLFYQHNPYGWSWGNMHWGHAVSRDLMHWEELPIALYPQRFGDWCFSGSAIVDHRNTSGFKGPDEDVLVAAYTSTGRGESIATSLDRGRTWTDYIGNPVVRHQGRDPKIVWHEGTQRWVMAVYDEIADKQTIAFYMSPNLKQWEFQSRIEGFYECPDLFELPVGGPAPVEPSKQPGATDSSATASAAKWVLYGADGQYMLGRFDGREFLPETGKHQVWFGNFYAAQTYSDAPGDRRIQIGWGRGITFPGMPFNQQMTIPVELSLRTTDAGVRMFAEPVREIELLHRRKHNLENLRLDSTEMPLSQLTGNLFDIRADFELVGDERAQSFGFVVRGIPVVYDAANQVMRCRDVVAPLQLLDRRARLQILVDRGSIEIFGNAGRVAISVAAVFPEDNQRISVFAHGGSVLARTLDVFELNSAWTDDIE